MKNSLPFLFHYAASGLQLLNVLFAVLLIITLNRQTTALAALFGVLLAACVILPVVTLITEHKRMKKLLKKAYRENLIT